MQISSQFGPPTAMNTKVFGAMGGQKIAITKPRTAGNDINTIDKGFNKQDDNNTQSDALDRYKYSGKRGPIKPSHRISTSIQDANRTGKTDSHHNKKHMFHISTNQGIAKSQVPRSSSQRPVFSADKPSDDNIRRNSYLPQTPSAKPSQGFSLSNVGGPSTGEKLKRRPSNII